MPKLEVIIPGSRRMIEMEGMLKQAHEQIAVLETRIIEITNKKGYESNLQMSSLISLVRTIFLLDPAS